jgi:polyribonucleotide nucleotidyltransferase
LLETALGQANVGRKHILRKMLDAVPRRSADIANEALRFAAIEIPGEKIGDRIGPGGRTIQLLQADYGVRISDLRHRRQRARLRQRVFERESLRRRDPRHVRNAEDRR